MNIIPVEKRASALRYRRTILIPVSAEIRAGMFAASHQSKGGSPALNTQTPCSLVSEPVSCSGARCNLIPVALHMEGSRPVPDVNPPSTPRESQAGRFCLHGDLLNRFSFGYLPLKQKRLWQRSGTANLECSEIFVQSPSGTSGAESIQS